MIADAHFVGELFAGRTIPLQLLLFAIALGLLASNSIGNARGAIIGLVLGLAILNRFDALVPALVIGCGILLWTQRLPVLLSYFGALMAMLSPWILYSLAVHGVFFSSDNNGVAFAAVPVHATDFHLERVPTLSTEPILWVKKVAGNLVQLVFAIDKSSRKYLVGALILGLIGLLCRAWQGSGSTSEKWRHQLPALSIFAVALAVQCVSFVATGYFDGRYFSPLRWLLMVAVFGFVAVQTKPMYRAGSTLILGLSVPLAIIGAVINDSFKNPHLTPAIIRDAAEVWRCLQGETNVTIVFLESNLAFPFGALHGSTTLHSAHEPGNFKNLDSNAKTAFLRYIRATHAYGSAAAIAKIPDGFRPVRLEGCAAPVWALESAESASHINRAPPANASLELGHSESLTKSAVRGGG